MSIVAMWAELAKDLEAEIVRVRAEVDRLKVELDRYRAIAEEVGYQIRALPGEMEKLAEQNPGVRQALKTEVLEEWAEKLLVPPEGENLLLDQLDILRAERDEAKAVLSDILRDARPDDQSLRGVAAAHWEALTIEAAGLLERLLPHCSDQEYVGEDGFALRDTEAFLARVKRDHPNMEIDTR